MEWTLDDLAPEQAGEAIALWNNALGAGFPMTPRLWRQVVTDDPNATRDDILAAHEAAGTLAGFAIIRQFRQLDAVPGLEWARGRGWILALVIAPGQQRRGLGGHLLRAAEARLHRRGAILCEAGGGIEHLLPGQPLPLTGTATDDPVAAFWSRNGYAPAGEEYDLQRSLTGFELPPSLPQIQRGDVRIRPGTRGDEAPLLAFLARTFPGRWHYDVAQALARGQSIEDIILLRDRDDAIQGFLCSWHHSSTLLGPSTYWHPILGDRFGGMGPLGIAPAMRGHGLGLALVAFAIAFLSQQGVETCAVDWTTLTGFYGALGFQPVRHYLRFHSKRLTAASS